MPRKKANTLVRENDEVNDCSLEKTTTSSTKNKATKPKVSKRVKSKEEEIAVDPDDLEAFLSTQRTFERPTVKKAQVSSSNISQVPLKAASKLFTISKEVFNSTPPDSERQTLFENIKLRRIQRGDQSLMAPPVCSDDADAVYENDFLK